MAGLAAPAGARTVAQADLDQNGFKLYGIPLVPDRASGAVPLQFVTPGAGYLVSSGLNGTIAANASIPLADLYTTSVANVTALEALAGSGYRDGARVYVQSLSADFVFHTTNTTTVDHKMIASVSGMANARWLRDPHADGTQFNQLNWFVNTGTGSDENDCVSSGTACLTFAEVRRRLIDRYVPIGNTQSITITVAGNLGDQDPIAVDMLLVARNNATTVTVMGTPTTTSLGAIASRTLNNYSVNQADEITITGLDWTPYVGKIIRRVGTTGTSGQTSVVVATCGTGCARVTRVQVFGGPGTAWAVSDGVEALTLPKAQGVRAGFDGLMLVGDFDFDPGTSVSVQAQVGGVSIFSSTFKGTAAGNFVDRGIQDINVGGCAFSTRNFTAFGNISVSWSLLLNVANFNVSNPRAGRNEWQDPILVSSGITVGEWTHIRFHSLGVYGLAASGIAVGMQDGANLAFTDVVYGTGNDSTSKAFSFISDNHVYFSGPAAGSIPADVGNAAVIPGPGVTIAKTDLPYYRDIWGNEIQIAPNVDPTKHLAVAGGDITYVVGAPSQVTAIHETSGPTQLTIGAMANGTWGKRVGSTFVGSAIVVGDVSGAVPTTRTITAGAGMIGGGDFSVDRTLDVVANADGTMVVNANDIQVGVIQTANIAGDAVTNAKLANMPNARFKARVTAGTGDPEDITGTQATTLLDQFTTSLQGVVPGSGGGSSNFLRADGTWTVPPGTGTTGITQLTGDGTAGPGSGSQVFALTNVPSDTTMAGDLLATAIAAPASPASGKGRVYFDLTSLNLAAKNASGTVNHGVQTAAAVSHQFVTAISDAGSVTLAQPSYADISGTPTLFYQTIQSAGSAVTQRGTWNASTGLTAVDNGGSSRTDVTVNLSTGVSGGQSVVGGTGASDDLTLSSTSNSTKGRILIGGTATSLNEATGAVVVQSAGLNDTLKVTSTNATSGGVYVRNTQSAAQTVLYFDNDRGSFASYGGILNGGSTNAIGSIFGLSRADRVFIFSDGASSQGLGIGTLTPDDVTIGTNNTTRVTVAANGDFTVSSLGSAMVKAVSGKLQNATSGTDYQAPIAWPATCAGGASHCERFITSPGGTGSTNPSSGLQVEYDFDNDHLAISDDASIAIHGTGSGGPASANMAFLHLFAGSSIYKIQSAKTGTGTIHPLAVSSTAGVTVDDYLQVNGASATTNDALVVGHTTSGNHDHVQFFIGGGSLYDSTNAFFDVFPSNTAIAGNLGVWATQRVRSYTISASSGSPTVTEAASLYLDGAPALSGVTAAHGPYTVHAAAGDVAFGSLAAGGYVVTQPPVSDGDGKLLVTTPPADLTYYVELTSGMIGTINSADQYLSTSAHDAVFPAASYKVEYPTAGTVGRYYVADACIVGTNTITSGSMTGFITINGSGGNIFTFSSATTGCQSTAGNNVGAASTDTFGLGLHGGGGGPSVSGTLKLSFRIRLTPVSPF